MNRYTVEQYASQFPLYVAKKVSATLSEMKDVRYFLYILMQLVFHLMWTY